MVMRYNGDLTSHCYGMAPDRLQSGELRDYDGELIGLPDYDLLLNSLILLGESFDNALSKLRHRSAIQLSFL